MSETGLFPCLRGERGKINMLDIVVVRVISV